MYGEGRKEREGRKGGRKGGRKKQEARSRTKIDDFLPSVGQTDRRINVRMGRPANAELEEDTAFEATIHSCVVEQTCFLQIMSMIYDLPRRDTVVYISMN